MIIVKREELDQLIKTQALQKEEQKKRDEAIREKFRLEQEEFKEKERLHRLKMRQAAQEMVEQSLRESQNKAQYEVNMKL